VVAETADRVLVQYAGEQVEKQTTRDLFREPRHPYTAALLAALPERAVGHERLPAIPGVVPGQFDRPQGCLFSPRCQFVFERCHSERPLPAGPELGEARCHTPLVAGRPLARAESAA
jgi:dipeptide transport system ATP-binding protein